MINATLRQRTVKRQVLFLLVAIALSVFSYAQVPLANFTASTTAGCSPIVVNFTDLSTNNPTSWSWNFGNGSTSTLQNPTATYFTPGSYTVTLTATNATGSNTLTRTAYITVYSQPTVDFTANDTAGCFPHAVQFTDLSDPGPGNSISSWEWDFGDGSNGNVQHPSHSYNTSGNFTVTLKVTNDKGCVRIYSRQQYIRVTPGVIPNFNNTVPTDCSPPLNITFTSTSTGPGLLSHSWNFGDGGIGTGTTPTHTYTAPGTYPVSLTVTSDQGCSATITKDSAVVIDTLITDFIAPDSVCVFQNVYFQNTTTPNPISYSWDFGNGLGHSATNPFTSYTTPGTYNVKLRAYFSFCIDSVIKQIVVLPKPTGDFTAPDTVKCQPPHTVNFQDLSTNGAVQWEWHFGDGGTSNLQNPSHTYTSLGDFNVTLITTNAVGCSDTITKPAFVKIRRPVILFPQFPAEGCVPYTITFNSSIVTFDNVTSWFWDFGDGNTSTQQFPTHTYPNQGIYTVTLTVTTSGGCTETRSYGGAIRIGTRPTVDFSASPLVSCAKKNIQFTDLSVPADQWVWDFGDGSTSTLQNPTHQYTDTGYFSIELVAVNNGCRDSITKTNYIRILPPVARFNISLACSNRNTYTFTDNSVAPQTWFWDFGDGTTSNLQNPPPHNYAALGTYNVMLTVTNGACTDTAIRQVRVINENPDVNAVPTAICRNDSITFTGTNINTVNIEHYEWSYGDGTIDSTTSPTTTHTYTSSGYYTIRLVTTDYNGCQDTIIKNNYVRVNGPDANFGLLNASGCSGSTFTFIDSTITDGLNSIVSWWFDFGDSTSQTFSSPPFTHVYDEPGTYDVSMIVTDAAGCIDSIRYDDIVTTSDPFVNFFTNQTLSCPGAYVYFINLSNGENLTYSWQFGDGTDTTVKDPPHIYYNVGSYDVTLVVTDQYGCSDSITKPQYVSVDRPIANFFMDDSISSCIPFEVQFTNASSYFYSSWWDFGDGGASILSDPVHYFTTPGVYNVELKVVSVGSCLDSITKVVTLYDTAGTRFNYTPFNGCKPHTVDFNVTTNFPATFTWDFGDGQAIINNNSSITYTYTTFGKFIPKVILEDPAGCIIPLPGFDTVRVAGATAHFGYDDSLFCDQGIVHFTDSTTFNDDVVNFFWDFGDGNTSTQQHPTHTYIGEGYYSVYLAVETLVGCRDTLRKDSLIKVVNRPLIRIDSDSSVCVYSQLEIEGFFIRPDTSIVTWYWDFDNGLYSDMQDPPDQTYFTPGSHVITAIAANTTGCKDTARRPILVHPLPTVNMPPEVTIVAGTSLQIPAVYSGNMTSYTWSPAINLSCINCPLPIASPTRNTIYTTTFVDSNGCENIGSMLFRVLCGKQNIFIPNTFSPNGDGSNDVFYPRGAGLNRTKVLRIFNRWGEVIFERQDFPSNDPAFGWDGTHNGQRAPAGVYVYQVEIYCDNNELVTFDGNITLIR